MSDPTTLRACASALRRFHEVWPHVKAEHLADWCEREADGIERLRRELETWPAPRDDLNSEAGYEVEAAATDPRTTGED